MADFLSVATTFLLVGLELLYLGFIQVEQIGTRRDEVVEALLIIALLCALASAVLVILIKAGDMAGNKIALCCVIGFSLVAGNVALSTYS